MNRQRLGHYRILEKLGEGSMGEVFLAEDTTMGRQVALKLLPPELAEDEERLARFEREVRLLASLNHPNIITIYSVEKSKGSRFFTMELVDGKSLDRLIPADGFALEKFLEVAVPLTDALTAAHDKGIHHRDLKPANIMISRDHRLKVLDFGLAKPWSATAEEVSDAVTAVWAQEGVILGTIPYMSPEQLSGEDTDDRSDIFSLGVVLYEMASGHRPFRGDSIPALISSVLRDTPRSVGDVRADLPCQLVQLIAHCLEKDPQRRSQSVLDLRNQLDDLAKGTAEEDGGRSIAVLPFVDMSSEKNQDYFCEGIAEELIGALAKIQGLRVVSRTSSFRFKGAADIREIGYQLNVSTLVEGSVRKAGNRLRINAQLINVSDGYHLWSQTYDRRAEDIFTIQEEIAHSIVQALEVRLSPKERRDLRMVSTDDAEAYDYYLRGRSFYDQYTRRGVRLAQQMFNQAIECDPNYALAYAGIADCCAYLFVNAENREENRIRAERTSRKAIELDPDLAPAHSSRGVALSLSASNEEAEEAFKTAIRLDPELFEGHFFYARHCFTLGREEEALELYQLAMKLRPEDYQSGLLVAQIYDDLDRGDEAAETRRKGVKTADEWLKHHPEDTRALYMGANGLVALGEHERGLRWARQAMALDPEEPLVLYNLACVYSLAGKIDEGVEILERAHACGFTNKSWIEHDSNLDALRGDPRFKALMERLSEAAHASYSV